MECVYSLLTLSVLLSFVSGFLKQLGKINSEESTSRILRRKRWG